MSTEESAKVSVLTERIDHLIERLDKFEELAEARFVMRVEYAPVQRIVYGGVGIMLSLVMVALMGVALFHK